MLLLNCIIQPENRVKRKRKGENLTRTGYFTNLQPYIERERRFDTACGRVKNAAKEGESRY